MPSPPGPRVPHVRRIPRAYYAAFRNGGQAEVLGESAVASDTGQVAVAAEVFAYGAAPILLTPAQEATALVGLCA